MDLTCHANSHPSADHNTSLLRLDDPKHHVVFLYFPQVPDVSRSSLSPDV